MASPSWPSPSSGKHQWGSPQAAVHGGRWGKLWWAGGLAVALAGAPEPRLLASAGIMVRKMPTNSRPTSLTGKSENPFAS